MHFLNFNLPKSQINKIKWIIKEKYRGKLNEKIKQDIKGLKKDEPLDYIIGFSNFFGCKIDLSKRPLIPRVETEFWVQDAVNRIKNPKYSQGRDSLKEIKVLDIFSGSGCIGIVLLKNIKNSKVVFAEKNKDFLEQIKINCRLNNVEKNRYKIVQSDIFSKVSGKYDYIFANPPYIAKNRANKIQKSVLKYEPKSSLFGGTDGLFYIRKFLVQARNFLNERGVLYMEFDFVQKKQIEELLKKFQYKEFEFHKDQYGKWRYLYTISY